MQKYRRLGIPLILAGAILLAVGAGLGAVAHSAARAKPTAVAVLDLERLFGTLDEVAQKRRSLDARIAEWQQSINAIGQEIERLEDDLRTLNLTEDQRLNLVFRAAMLNEQRKAEVAGRTQLLSLEEGRIYRDTYKNVVAAVSRYASQEGFDIVLLDDRSMQIPERAPSQNVQAAILSKQIFFAHDALDVTAAVATIMNNDFASGAATRRN